MPRLPLYCRILLLAGLASWGALVRSRPTGPAWAIAWVLAPILVVILQCASLDAWRQREPGDVVQLPGAVGLGLLVLIGWGWVSNAVPAVGWMLGGLIALLGVLVTVAAWLEAREYARSGRRWIACAPFGPAAAS